MPDSNSGAYAPYNFVRLPEKVQKVDPPPSLDRYYPKAERLSGYFDCTLKTLTPLYIRSTLKDDEYKERSEREKKGIKKEARHDKADFFSPGGQLRIPGSSLRGMTRTLVEVLSSSAIQAVGNQQLFFRNVGDVTKSSIAANYREKLLENRQAGCIVKDRNKYLIYPSVPAQNDDRTIFRIEPTTVKSLLELSEYNLNWKRKPVWFELPKLGFDKVTNVSLRKSGVPAPNSNWRTGWLIVPGKEPPPNRRSTKPVVKKHWIITEADYDLDKAISISYEDMLAYRDDGITRDINQNKFSVLPEQEGNQFACPCFFTRWKDNEDKEHISFGHTAYFRLPYKNRPSNLVPEENRASDKELDFTQALFGVAADKAKIGKAGRVFFEDAVLEPLAQTAPLFPNEMRPKILSSPKPTSFQHYLEQPEAVRLMVNSEEWIGALKFWDSDSKEKLKIRGHKLYWHRQANDWQETPEKADSSQHTYIQPVREGVTFRFRVRFENLSEAELGALATALFLPEGLAHKLGMGKPLGLGSVRIEGVLKLIDRQTRYSALFVESGDSWETGLSPESNLTSYQQAFTNWLFTDEKDKPKTIWEDTKNTRLKELKIMLTYEGRPPGFNERTRYMTITSKEYNNRYILLSPHEVWEGKADPPQPPRRDNQPDSSQNRSNPSPSGVRDAIDNKPASAQPVEIGAKYLAAVTKVDKNTELAVKEVSSDKELKWLIRKSEAQGFELKVGQELEVEVIKVEDSLERWLIGCQIISGAEPKAITAPPPQPKKDSREEIFRRTEKEAQNKGKA